MDKLLGDNTYIDKIIATSEKIARFLFCKMKEEKKYTSDLSDSVRLALIEQNVDYIKGSIQKIEKAMADNYVTYKEFDVYKKLFWLVAGVLAAQVTQTIFSYFN